MSHDAAAGTANGTAKPELASSLSGLFAALRTVSTAFTALLLLLLSETSSAAEAVRPAYIPPASVVNAGGVVQIIISLLLVLAAIVAVAWLLKRTNLTRQGTGNLLRILGGVSVGQRERVVLIEVLDSWLVVGVGPGQIRTLHVLEKPLDPLQSGVEAVEQTTPANRFSTILGAMLKPRSTDEKNDAR
jgi:flagellar protein FliO/FliZ